MAHLEVVSGPAAGTIHLSQSPLTIGRDRRCELVLAHPHVSREHARIEAEEGRYFLSDLGSKHGTSLNGKPVSTRSRLEAGDLISLSGIVLRFHSPAPQPAEEDPAEPPNVDDNSTIIMSTLDAKVSTDRLGEVASAAKLRAIMEIIDCLGSTLKREEFLPRTLDSLMSVFPHAASSLVLLTEGGCEQLVPVASRCRGGTSQVAPPVSQTISSRALNQCEAILCGDTSVDQSFSKSMSINNLGIRSFACIPLVRKDGSALGLLQLHSEHQGKMFREEDLDILVAVAQAITMAMENLQLHQELLQQEKLQQELDLARDVQQHFLSAAPPSIPGYSFAASYHSARSVGGDYYAFIPLGQQQLALALGDVSGKGIAAALLMARLASDVRYAILAERDPGNALRAVNQELHEADLDDRFITLVLMVLDYQHHTLTIANAGHLPVLLRSPAGVKQIGMDVAGLPLMANPDPDEVYRVQQISMPEGGTLLAYTDGLIESRSPSGEDYGLQRLQQRLADAPAPKPAHLVDLLLRETSDFSAGRPPADDLTLLSMGRLAAK
jgi:serine phosphatase RsbU (regulator of sigma subunit)